MNIEKFQISNTTTDAPPIVPDIATGQPFTDSRGLQGKQHQSAVLMLPNPLLIFLVHAKALSG